MNFPFDILIIQMYNESEAESTLYETGKPRGYSEIHKEQKSKIENDTFFVSDEIYSLQ